MREAISHVLGGSINHCVHNRELRRSREFAPVAIPVEDILRRAIRRPSKTDHLLRLGSVPTLRANRRRKEKHPQESNEQLGRSVHRVGGEQTAKRGSCIVSSANEEREKKEKKRKKKKKTAQGGSMH